MYSPAQPRVTLAANRSVSCNVFNPNVGEPKHITNSPIRHSSSDLQPPKHEVNSEKLGSARHSVDVAQHSPKQRPLPPVPSSTSSKQLSPPTTLSHIPTHSRSKSAPNIECPQDLTGSLSPNAKLIPRRPLPAPPIPPKRASPQLPRATTNSNLPLANAPMASVTEYLETVPLDITAPDLLPVGTTPDLLPLDTVPDLLPVDVTASFAPSPADTTASPEIPLDTSALTVPPLDLDTTSAVPQDDTYNPALQDGKKDTKYLSNPEPAVTMKDGVCQRHLSAPSTVLSDNQLSGSSDDVDDIVKDFVPIETNSSRASVDLSGDPNSPNLRSWYLKKSSTLGRSSLQILPKERPEYRTLRKALPDMVEVTPKNKVMKELLVTEALFVDDLCVTIKVFMEPIKRYKTLSEGDVSALFSNIQELYDSSKALLSSLIELIPQINEHHTDTSYCPPIGDVFLKHLPSFYGYTTYLCNKELSLRVATQVNSLAHFKSLMVECRENPECNGLGLGDYLIKPVQRLCKYPLLFKEMRKYLLPDDPQIPVLTNVIAEIEKLTEVTNKTITNTEKLNQIKKIMGIDISPLLDGATVLREGTLFVVIKRSKKEEVFFWLLDKVILWHPMRATLRKIRANKGKNFILVSAISSLCEDEFERHKLSFSIKFTNESRKEKAIGFCAMSYLEKLCWIEDIKAQLT